MVRGRFRTGLQDSASRGVGCSSTVEVKVDNFLHCSAGQLLLNGPARFMSCWFLALYLLSTPSLAAAQSIHTIPRILQSPTIDGQLDTGEWAGAISIPVNIEISPGDNVPAEVEAEALLMENGEILYVAFIAQDPDPEQIRAYYQDRDNAWSDDWMGIILDTFNDERRAFEFFVNPLGVQIDAIYDDVNGRDDIKYVESVYRLMRAHPETIMNSKF